MSCSRNWRRWGSQLRGVSMGKVDLPPDYRAGMEKLLAEELETEKVRYTLQLKEAQVKQTQLEGEADKVRREKSAEAAGQEQVIAARAQEETMKHILPFKQKQIEQRQLEAEADKVARIRTRRGSGGGSPHRGPGRSRFAPEARRCGGLPARARGQGQRRSDGTRGRAPGAVSAADPEDPCRQALRQGAGHHRTDACGRVTSSAPTSSALHGREGQRAGARGPVGKRPLMLAIAAVLAIVVQDHTCLRAAPRAEATALTALWQGDVLEVREERADYLKVYDYRHERSGYLRSDRVRPVGTAATRCAAAAGGPALSAR